jgi:hypothetical protein
MTPAATAVRSTIPSMLTCSCRACAPDPHRAEAVEDRTAHGRGEVAVARSRHSRYSCQLVRSSTPLVGGLQAGELLGVPGGIDPAGIKVTIGKVLEGPTDPATGPHMMDNITINDRGQVLIQEDVGNNPYLGGVYQFDPASRAIGRIAQHDPNRFGPGGSTFETVDEESSGVVPAPFLGEGKYLIDVQNHLPSADPQLVEKGQLLVMNVPPGKPVGK